MIVNFDDSPNGYICGHVEPFWIEDDYKNLSYEKTVKGLDTELEKWFSMGYPKDTNFYGCLYDNRNPTPAFATKFAEIFADVSNMTYTFYKMTTATIMPEHVDHFTTYKKIFNVEDKNIVRILVMLEDWKSGHYLEIDKKAFVNWSAGDYFIWKNHVSHSAANIGAITYPRYTLQITGTLVNNKGYINDL